jgi:hypothetical protein
VQIVLIGECNAEGIDSGAELLRSHSREEANVMLALLIIHEDQLVDSTEIGGVVRGVMGQFMMVSPIDSELRRWDPISANPTRTSPVSLDCWLNQPPDICFWRALEQLLLAFPDCAVAGTANAMEDKLTPETSQRRWDDVITFAS